MGKAYLDLHPPKVRQFREPRRAKPTGCVVVHTAESVLDSVGPDTGAENVAKFMVGRSDYGSYHRLVDSDSIVKLVRFGCEAYGDGTGSNPFAIHISAACRTTDWRKMDDDQLAGFIANMAKAANEARLWLKATHGIDLPAKRITRAQSEAGKAGFITHGERDPGRRTDPGADFPWKDFFAAYKALSQPAKVIVESTTKGDKYQQLRRKILASEESGTAFVADLVDAEAEARAVGQKAVAARLRVRIKSEKAYIGRLGKRRVALRVKKK